MDRDDIRDQDLAESRGEGRGEGADLVGVRKDNVSRRRLFYRLFKRVDVPVGGVLLEQRMLDAEYFAELFPAEFLGERPDAFAQNYGRAVGAELLRQHLACGERFLTDAVQAISVLMFDDDQDSAHSTLTSDCSLSTSCAAISAGVPRSIWVHFCFSGR